jgi:hypothetical protein
VGPRLYLARTGPVQCEDFRLQAVTDLLADQMQVVDAVPASVPKARTALINNKRSRQGWVTVMGLLIKVSATNRWSAGYNR